MKIKLELNFPDDRTFLNFWNYMNGDDVCCEVRDGKLFLDEKEITLAEFIEMVKGRTEDW